VQTISLLPEEKPGQTDTGDLIAVFIFGLIVFILTLLHPGSSGVGKDERAGIRASQARSTHPGVPTNRRP
jgi:hypothetical protein